MISWTHKAALTVCIWQQIERKIDRCRHQSIQRFVMNSGMMVRGGRAHHSRMNFVPIWMHMGKCCLKSNHKIIELITISEFATGRRVKFWYQQHQSDYFRKNQLITVTSYRGNQVIHRMAVPTNGFDQTPTIGPVFRGQPAEMLCKLIMVAE